MTIASSAGTSRRSLDRHGRVESGCFSFAKEAMLNINAFFEFKQRTRHIHSFQLAQLIYHAQHLNEFYALPQNIAPEPTRRVSIPSSEDSVSLAHSEGRDGSRQRWRGFLFF